MADPFTPKFVDLVRNYTTTTGTGDFKLGAAVNGYSGITAGCQVGDRFYYSAIGVDKLAEREVGRGTLLANGVVKREPISGSKTNFTSGTKSIALIAAAEWFSNVQASAGQSPRVAATRNELAGAIQHEWPAILTEPGREGLFTWDASNLSAQVAADSAQGVYIAPASDASGSSGAWIRQFSGPILGNWFGMKVDGVTNDTLAADAFSKFIQFKKGGSFAIRGKTCILGLQPAVGSPGPGGAFLPVVQYPLDITGCDSPVVLDASTVKFKLPNAYKYGSFNADGTPKATANGYMGDGLSTPLYAFFRECGNTAGVTFLFGEMDGNMANADLGGKWGDNDWQIACTGIQLGHWDGAQSTCHRRIVGKRVHHMPCDGITLNHPGLTANDPFYGVTLEEIAFDYNARNNFSWCGGKGVVSLNCNFNRAGKGAWASAPRKGIDFEPEAGAVVGHGHFFGGEIIDNAWAGVGAYGAAHHIEFHGTKIVGATGASVADPGPYWKFHNCPITGQLINLYPSAVPAEATQFYQCEFLFGPARSPTGVVYAPAGHMMDLGGLGAQNILFKRCLLDAEDNAAVKLSYLSGATMEDCTLKQPAGSAQGVAQGVTWRGKNTITAAAGVDLFGLINRGELTVNGVKNAQTFSWDVLAETEVSAAALKATGQFINSGGPQVQISYGTGGADRGWIHSTHPGVIAKPLTISATGDITLTAPVIAESSLTAAGAVSGSNLNASGFPTSVGTGTVIGRSAAGTGAASALTTVPTAAMPAHTGDVTSSAGSVALTIANDAVTYAKMQNVASSRLLGNPTGVSADPSEVSLSSDLTFSGTALQVGAFTGDISKSAGSLATAVASNAVTYSKIQQAAPARLLGNPTGAPANVQEISLAGGLSFSGTTLTIGAITPTSVAATGAITSTAGGVGYATGAGGIVVQATSKSTGVTLNKLCGQITTNSAALATNAGVSFTVTDNQVAATDTIDLVLASGNATAGTYNYQVDKVAAGSFVIWFKNISAGSLSEALTFNFSIKKAVSA